MNRRHQRYPTRLQAEAVSSEQLVGLVADAVFQVEVSDVSMGGLRLHAPARRIAGGVQALRVRIHGSVVRGRVVWMRLLDAENAIVGLALDPDHAEVDSGYVELVGRFERAARV